MSVVPATNSQSFSMTRSEIDGIQLALEQLRIYNNKLKKEGMSKYAFFLGVFNVGITVFLIGVYPEYYWIVFLCKSVIIYPTRLYLGHKQKDNYYLLDFCWMSCYCTLLLFVFVATGLLDTETTKQAMRIIFTFSCGTQGWAAIIFSNSLVFHSIMHTCSVFIHLTPVILCYTIRWNIDELHDTFPDFFPLSEDLLADNLWKDLYIPALITYNVWWILYSIWLCTHALTLPAKGYDTVWNWLYTSKPGFRNIIDSIAQKLFKQERNKQTRAKCMIYMVQHYIMATITMLWGLLCYEYQLIHLLFIVLISSSIIWKGASYYNYLTLIAPAKHVESVLKKIEICYPNNFKSSSVGSDLNGYSTVVVSNKNQYQQPINIESSSQRDSNNQLKKESSPKYKEAQAMVDFEKIAINDN